MALRQGGAARGARSARRHAEHGAPQRLRRLRAADRDARPVPRGRWPCTPRGTRSARRRRGELASALASIGRLRAPKRSAAVVVGAGAVQGPGEDGVAAAPDRAADPSGGRGRGRVDGGVGEGGRGRAAGLLRGVGPPGSGAPRGRGAARGDRHAAGGSSPRGRRGRAAIRARLARPGGVAGGRAGRARPRVVRERPGGARARRRRRGRAGVRRGGARGRASLAGARDRRDRRRRAPLDRTVAERGRGAFRVRVRAPDAGRADRLERPAAASPRERGRGRGAIGPRPPALRADRPGVERRGDGRRARPRAHPRGEPLRRPSHREPGGGRLHGLPAAAVHAAAGPGGPTASTSCSARRGRPRSRRGRGAGPPTAAASRALRGCPGFTPRRSPASAPRSTSRRSRRIAPRS